MFSSVLLAAAFLRQSSLSVRPGGHQSTADEPLPARPAAWLSTDD